MKTLQVVCAAFLVISALPALAQRGQGTPVVALLLTGARADSEPMTAAFRQGLRDLGYAEGRNIAIDVRWADLPQRLPDLVQDVLRSRVDIIVTQGTPAAQAAKRATSTIPIVMATAGDPVATGLVASLARPGGNVTGNSILGPDAAGKRLDLLRQIVPRASRIAAVSNPLNPTHALFLAQTESAARTLGVSILALEARSPDDMDRVLETAVNGRADALLMFGDPLFTAHRGRLAALAIKNRLPTLYELSGFAEAGGLVQYGVNLPQMFRRAAAYVDRILKGAKPGELPVEQAGKLELVINLKTAKILGVTIEPAVLLQADRVLE